jgi:hypothetical protein
VPDKSQIVRDYDIGEPKLFLQIHEQINDLRLNRDIEGTDGLIQNKDLRLADDGPRNGYALPESSLG